MGWRQKILALLGPDGTVGSAELTDGGVATVDLAANAVTTAKIADGNVTTAKLAAGAVTANELGASAVETAKINDLAVSTAKLAAGAVTPAKADADLKHFSKVVPLKAPAATGLLASGIYLPFAGSLTGLRVRAGTLPAAAGDEFAFNASIDGSDVFSGNQSFDRDPNPIGALVSVDDEATYSPYLIEVTGAGHMQLDALDTAANGDRFYICGADLFAAILATMVGGEVNAIVSALSLEAWTGAAWTAVTGVSDGTAVAGATLAQDGVISFTPPHNWAKSTIEGVNGYWLRGSVSVLLSATVSIDTITLLRQAQHGYAFSADQNQAFTAGAELRIRCTEADAAADGLEAEIFGTIG